jgi:hypothetical protein
MDYIKTANEMADKISVTTRFFFDTSDKKDRDVYITQIKKLKAQQQRFLTLAAKKISNNNQLKFFE